MWLVSGQSMVRSRARGSRCGLVDPHYVDVGSVGRGAASVGAAHVHGWAFPECARGLADCGVSVRRIERANSLTARRQAWLPVAGPPAAPVPRTDRFGPSACARWRALACSCRWPCARQVTAGDDRAGGHAVGERRDMHVDRVALGRIGVERRRLASRVRVARLFGESRPVLADLRAGVHRRPVRPWRRRCLRARATDTWCRLRDGACAG